MNNENMNGFQNMGGNEFGQNTGVMGNVGSVPQQPMSQPEPVVASQPSMAQVQTPNVQPVSSVNPNTNPQTIDPSINVGQNIQPENIKVQPADLNAEQPKYGFESNENKASLNDENSSNLKFVIILAILMLAFIIMLPYLSNLL